MARQVYSVLLLLLAVLPAVADNAEDLDNWFRDGYAAVYTENSWDHADEFAQYFTDVIHFRSDEGVVAVDINEFLLDSLEVWRDEGWLGSDVDRLDTRMLTATTVLFDIKWRDRNADGSTGSECGWYIADKIDGEWLLSQYIQMECAD